MRVYKLLCFCILLAPSFHAHSQCVDPNFTVITFCGHTFDLCLDNYGLGVNQQWELLNVFSNDEGEFDPCASDVVSNPLYGDVYRVQYVLDNQGSFSPAIPQDLIIEMQNVDPCLFVYRANTSSGALLDQFDYEFKVNDTCSSDDDYCDPNGSSPGKIWSIYSKYVGAAPVYKIQVFDMQGQTPTIFEDQDYSADPITTGEYFYAEGYGLGKNQSTWRFRFYYDLGFTNFKDVNVHTSCSFQIFGTPHPVNADFTPITDPNDPNFVNVFTPIAGCVSTPEGGKDGVGPSSTVGCIDYSNQTNLRSGINVRADVSTQFSDVTTVTINRTILPLLLSSFTITSRDQDNLIQWTVESSKNEFEMVLEKSNDGINFYPKKSFINIALQTYTFFDKDISKKDHYYRIKSISYDGIVTYSNIKYIEREVDSTIKISPNPTKGLMQLSIYSNQLDRIANINIFDMAGKRLYGQAVGQSTKEIDLKSLGLSSGIYIIEISSENGLRKIDKIVLE